MQLVDILRETENKMYHLHKAIDKVSGEPDFKESIAVLTEIIQDYQGQIDKVKSTLGSLEIGSNQHQGNGNGAAPNHNNNLGGNHTKQN